jgi:hypothetical protein
MQEHCPPENHSLFATRHSLPFWLKSVSKKTKPAKAGWEKLEGASPDAPKIFRQCMSTALQNLLFAIRYSPLAFHHSPIASRCRSVNYPSIPAVPSFVLAENDRNEVTEMAKLKTKEEKRKVADMTVDELAELVRQILREELKFLCSVDDEGNLVFWCEEAYARYVELLGKKPSEVKAYWVEGGMKFRYSDDEVTPELAKELDEAKRDIEAGRLIPYEQVRKELGL